MRHGLFKKKMACPRSMTQKKERKNGHINVHEKKKEKKKKIYIWPCPHVIQIKEREIHKRSISFHHPPYTYVHDLDQLV